MDNYVKVPPAVIIRFIPTLSSHHWVRTVETEPPTFEDSVKENGFASLQEFNVMVANVDINTAFKFAMFKAWQENDGTKAGLEDLPTR